MNGEYNCSVLLSEVLTAHLLIYSIFTVKALNKNMTAKELIVDPCGQTNIVKQTDEKCLVKNQ